jgi:hypothetical protein
MTHWTDMLLAPKELTPEYIVEESEDWWVCKCGNQPHYEGFYTCTPIGEIISPSINDGWDEVHYVCHRCWRIIDQNTLQVVGRCSEDVYNTNNEFRWETY